MTSATTPSVHAPVRVSIDPGLMDLLVPEPEMPHEPADRPAWLRLVRAARSRRAAERSALAAHALREALRSSRGRAFDIAHLPFSWKGQGCSLSLSVSEAGTMRVEVSPWSGEAAFCTFGHRDMAERLLANRRGAGRRAL